MTSWNLEAAGISAEAATVTLSLASAAIWGTSDFVGGIAARRLPSSAVVMMSHTLSLVLLVSLAVIHASRLPDTPSAIYGALAGLACGTGVMVLYKALALGSMGLTAAVSGVLAAVLPVLWAFATEGLPKERQIVGIVLAAVAIWMIARAPGAASSKQGLLLGAASGVSFGCLFILLKLAGRGGVLWPLAFSRIASTALAAGVTLITMLRKRVDAANLRGSRSSLRSERSTQDSGTVSKTTPRSEWNGRDRGAVGKSTARLGWGLVGLIAMAGVFDASGNTLYTVATRLGRLDIAAVLSSLYPASTIVLASVLLKERTTRAQVAGMVLAIAAVVLIAA